MENDLPGTVDTVRIMKPTEPRVMAREVRNNAELGRHYRPGGLLGLANPSVGAALTYTTYQGKMLGRLQTLGSDSTRATSYGNGTLERWETMVRPAPGARRSCTTPMYPQMKHFDVRCQ